MNDSQPERRWKRILRTVLRIVERGFAIIGFLAVSYHVCLNLSVVVSESMKPTLRGTGTSNGDWVLAEKVTYWVRRPKRWDVVAYRTEDGVQVMKRVIGLPGETVSLREGVLRVNGIPVKRPPCMASVKYYAYGNLVLGRTVKCRGGYYVLGDNSYDSQDSRFAGPLEPDRIKGRAWAVVWPPPRCRFLKP